MFFVDFWKIGKISFYGKEIDVVEWKGDILAVGVTEKDMVKRRKLEIPKLNLEETGLPIG